MEWLSRTQMLLGKEAIEKLKTARVAVFGVGGVGGAVVESLCRCGIGKIDIIDNDTINLTNLNRQILATTKNIGEFKTDVAQKRMQEINPKIDTKGFKIFFSPQNSSEFDFSQYDYIIDAIDSVTSKIELILKAKEFNVPIISSMGTGNKINPVEFEICDIYKTSVCPLARVMRYELKKRGVKKLKVVYSKELPIKINSKEKTPPASCAFVPPVAGYIISSEVVKDLINRPS